jgi:hypothetical protein
MLRDKSGLPDAGFTSDSYGILCADARMFRNLAPQPFQIRSPTDERGRRPWW